MKIGHNTDNYFVAETFINTIYILQRQQTVHRLKKRLWFHSVETTQTKHEHNPNNPNSLCTTQKKKKETDPAQQKQPKQLILTDIKNIFT